MSNYSDLWQVIKMRVCRNNKFAESSLANSNSFDAVRVKLRILQIFALECALQQYRLKHGTPFNPLEGKKALHHMIFEKTKWQLETIRTLSLNDSLFIINDELRLLELPPKASDFIQRLEIGLHVHPLDDFSQEDWEPKENSTFLQSLY
ncbi:ECs1072 family phage-associated protein [Enterobacter asburiae]|uniref:ECs1072 family phage-associated protein n=1 Tax=Enterobacter asburiae TaxID=61645 RepID=UPI001BCAF223|nr:hypothetical protein [Enterobacter asburiae]